LRAEVNEFLATALEEPLEAIKQKPEIAGLFGGAAVILFILITILFNLITPAKKVYYFNNLFHANYLMI